MGFCAIVPRRSHMQWALAPQDMVIAFGLAVVRERPVTADMLSMTASTFRAAMLRLKAAKLVVELDGRPQLVMPAFRPFSTLAAPYCFPAVIGTVVRGRRTAFSNTLSVGGHVDQFVWPDEQGNAVGRSILPLHKSVPMIVNASSCLWNVLALFDLVRVSEGHERCLAMREMTTILSAQESNHHHGTRTHLDRSLPGSRCNGA